jgi:crotonobetainyl-CoA:carnitine CoA-transferase CaiB-like acyl-CoA transferase
MESAIEGIRVVDLTTGVDGPFCAKLLADFGADVIKVELPEGDCSRRMDPIYQGTEGPESATFWYLNLNKRSVVLNYRDHSGLSLLKNLISRADVLVENEEPGQMSSLGLGYDEIHRTCPQIVMTSITPFGQEGPYARFKGPDIVRQAVSGFSDQGGLAGGEPMRAGGDLSYYVTGVAAAVATMIALHAREASNLGQHVDVSGAAVMTSCTGYETTKYSYGGGGATLKRGAHEDLPSLIAPCRNGYVSVSVCNQRQWTELCRLMHMEDLLEEFTFARLLLASVDSKDVSRRIREFVASWDGVELMVEAERRGVAIVSVPSVAELLTWPQHLAREFFKGVPFRGGAPVLQPGAPFKMSRTPWRLNEDVNVTPAGNVLGEWESNRRGD